MEKRDPDNMKELADMLLGIALLLAIIIYHFFFQHKPSTLVDLLAIPVMVMIVYKYCVLTARIRNRQNSGDKDRGGNSQT